MIYGQIGKSSIEGIIKEVYKIYGIDDFQLADIPRFEVRNFLAAGDFKGVSLAGSFKGDALPFCDDISADAHEANWVNLVIREDNGKLSGYNTDLDAMRRIIRKYNIDMKGKKVLVLGGDGNERTSVYCAKGFGAETVSVSMQNPEEVKKLRENSDAKILINATEIGAYPDNGKVPLNIDLFPECEVLIETIPNPIKTGLCIAAADKKILHIGGLELAFAQVQESSQVFLDKKFDDSFFDRVAKSFLIRAINIIILGPENSLKADLGRRIAKEMNRGYLEVKTIIQQKSGKSTDMIIADKGEAYYRDMEAQTIASIGKQMGKVIVADISAMYADCNYIPLTQNGIIIRMDDSSQPMDNVTHRNYAPLSVENSTSDAVIHKIMAALYKEVGISNQVTIKT